MKLGLHSRLLISQLVLLLVVFILLGAVLLTDADNRLGQHRETEARHQAMTLAEGSLDGLVSEDYELLERWVQSSMPSADYAYAGLVRPDGKIISHTDLSLIGNKIKIEPGLSESHLHQIIYQNRPVIEIIYPALIGENVIAYAHVAYYLDTESIFSSSIILHIIGVLVLSLALLITANHLIAKTITVPVEKLKQSVKQVSLEQPVKIESDIYERDDEIGELAHSFVEVSEQLVSSHSQLSSQMAEMSAIVETSMDGIIMIDQAGKIELVNSAVEEMFGFSKEELINQNVSCLMAGKHHSQHDKYLSRYFQTGEARIIDSRRTELEAARKDGSTMPIELSVREIQLQGKSKFVGMIRDITERYESEQAIMLAKEAAEEGSRVKSEFLATISHELRTPLNGIIGSIELIRDDGGISDETMEFINMADRSAQNLLLILNNILDFSDMEFDQIEVNYSKVNIRELLESIVEVYLHSIKDDPISLNYVVAETVPELIVIDRKHVQSVVRNLLNNAIKFTTSGQIRVLCTKVSDVHDSPCLRVEVEDTGIGIEEKDHDRIFDYFTQADGSFTRKYGGAGLGLSICKNVISQLDGEIGVTSELGKGSTFWFEIPIKPLTNIKVEEEHFSIPQEIRQSQNKDNENVHMLIVEDDLANRMILQAMLTKLGYRTDIAEDGQQAINKLENKSYDLILMDCQMPVMDGFIATKEIRKSEKENEHIPIIAVTANAMVQDREKCLKVGMDDYMAKPVNLVKLAQMLKKWISRGEIDSKLKSIG
ncbi:MAG: PAS domain S-box protein [Gammaproteobacteria bacterium]|nr:PAS domain S-box protein [Gammaproteobacteria bacterium]